MPVSRWTRLGSRHVIWRCVDLMRCGVRQPAVVLLHADACFTLEASCLTLTCTWPCKSLNTEDFGVVWVHVNRHCVHFRVKSRRAMTNFHDVQCEPALEIPDVGRRRSARRLPTVPTVTELFPTQSNANLDLIPSRLVGEGGEGGGVPGAVTLVSSTPLTCLRLCLETTQKFVSSSRDEVTTLHSKLSHKKDKGICLPSNFHCSQNKIFP